MADDGQKGLPPLTEAPPDDGLSEPLAYAQLIVPLPGEEQSNAPVQDNGPTIENFAPPRVVRRHPFEVYVVGQVSDGAWPILACAWGTVCAPHTANAPTLVSGRVSTTYTAAADSLFFIKAVMDADGAVTSAALNFRTLATITVPWPEYPEQFSADGLTWYHPIAHIRAGLGSPYESGEVVIHSSGYVIAQLTNTHLRVAQACGTDAGMTRHWKLEPGPGAIV